MNIPAPVQYWCGFHRRVILWCDENSGVALPSGAAHRKASFLVQRTGLRRILKNKISAD